MDGAGGDGAENVVRLPREWVGPPEELVPMGSRARAGEILGGADGDGADVTGLDAVPAADDFWSEGAAAMHGAIQPAGGQPGSAAPTATPPPAFATPSTHRPRRRRTRPIPRRPWGVVADAPARLARHRPRARVRAVAAAVGLACMLSAAALGLAEGGAHPSPQGHRALTSAGVTGSGLQRQLGSAAGDLPRARTSPADDARADRRSTSHQAGSAQAKAAARARSAARHHRLMQEKARRERRRDRTQAHQSAATTSGSGGTSTPTTAPTQAPTPTPTQTQTQTSPVQTATSPAATSASGASSTRTPSTHHSAYGETGVLGAGHSSGAS